MTTNELVGNDQAETNDKTPRCPICNSRVQALPQGRATFFECESCGFKLATARELYPNCFAFDPSELFPPFNE